MFAEPLLSSAEDRMEGMRRDMENCRPRDYHHYPQHHDTPDHLRDKSYHYSDSDDREVGVSELGSSNNHILSFIYTTHTHMKTQLFELKRMSHF